LRALRDIKYHPIGIIHTSFKKPLGTPIQPRSGKNDTGIVEVFREYVDGLKDLDGFSHIILLYHFHLAGESSLQVKPYMDEKTRGLFATRAPSRPNPIGMSIVRLLKIEGNKLHIQGVDVVDGTPLLDIKPYVPNFDVYEADQFGWLEKQVHKLEKTKDDGRFL
jgi:tRNA-Thr(GGU) m(6)t(6)A37 methyltransferase TsaA